MAHESSIITAEAVRKRSASEGPAPLMQVRPFLVMHCIQMCAISRTVHLQAPSVRACHRPATMDANYDYRFTEAVLSLCCGAQRTHSEFAAQLALALNSCSMKEPRDRPDSGNVASLESQTHASLVQKR